MIKLKLILIGSVLVTVTLLTAIFAWLWQHNQKDINPLPFPSSKTPLPNSVAHDMDEDRSTLPADNTLSIIHLCAISDIKEPLEAALVGFSHRYPHLSVQVTYSPHDSLNKDCPPEAQDIMLYSHPLSNETLQTLQHAINARNHPSSETDALIRPFNYTLQNNQRFEGALLSNKASAISLRNFLISSIGQDIFIDHGYDNIEGYNNRVDDLFNSNSNKTNAAPDDSIEHNQSLIGQ